MVVHGLECREGKEGKCSTVAHAADEEGETGADAVHQESLKWMVVECAKRVGDVQAMVARMEVLVQIWYVVEQAMKKVLPGVQERPINRDRKSVSLLLFSKMQTALPRSERKTYMAIKKRTMDSR